MRTVFVPPLSRDFSVLGFGCASLGSRVSPQQGERALAQAYERGVTWYDVAPPYGDGRAEALLGTFLTGRRDRVAICTKVGILRARPGFATRMIRPAARLAVKTFPNLRKHAAQFGRKNSAVFMSPQAIENSVVESLRLLRTDYVDVLALHDPSLAMCQDEATLAALEAILNKGYARCLSIAGAPGAIVAGSEASNLFRFAQFQDSPFLDARAVLQQHRATQGHFFITHSVFGAGALELLSARTKDPGALLFDYALANNANGIVLSSMFSRHHIETNCARASAPINPQAIARVRDLLA